CPNCGHDAVVRSTKKKAFFCISKEGGCGNRYAFGSREGNELEEQNPDREPNPDLADSWNTVIKMADKRALIAATLNGTAASDIFPQDVEDAGKGSDRQDVQQSLEGLPSSTEGVVIPQSWKEVEELVRSFGDFAWEDFRMFAADARHMLF